MREYEMCTLSKFVFLVQVRDCQIDHIVLLSYSDFIFLELVPNLLIDTWIRMGFIRDSKEIGREEWLRAPNNPFSVSIFNTDL